MYKRRYEKYSSLQLVEGAEVAQEAQRIRPKRFSVEGVVAALYFLEDPEASEER